MSHSRPVNLVETQRIGIKPMCSGRILILTAEIASVELHRVGDFSKIAVSGRIWLGNLSK